MELLAKVAEYKEAFKNNGINVDDNRIFDLVRTELNKGDGSRQRQDVLLGNNVLAATNSPILTNHHPAV